MSEFIIHKLPRPNANEVLYVHSLSVETLKGFVLQTRRYSTDDIPAEALAELANAQAVVLPYDGLNPMEATLCYLKPYYLDPNVSYFDQIASGLL
jgi:hypothetical protein